MCPPDYHSPQLSHSHSHSHTLSLQCTVCSYSQVTQSYEYKQETVKNKRSVRITRHILRCSYTQSIEKLIMKSSESWFFLLRVCTKSYNDLQKLKLQWSVNHRKWEASRKYFQQGLIRTIKTDLSCKTKTEIIEIKCTLMKEIHFFKPYVSLYLWLFEHTVTSNDFFSLHLTEISSTLPLHRYVFLWYKALLSLITNVTSVYATPIHVTRHYPPLATGHPFFLRHRLILLRCVCFCVGLVVLKLVWVMLASQSRQCSVLCSSRTPGIFYALVKLLLVNPSSRCLSFIRLPPYHTRYP